MLRADALVRRFGDRDVVADASLAVGEAESVALIGPSGCGKTTLLQMLGLLDRPTAGRVRLDGRDAWAGSRRERADTRLAQIGFVFQQNNLLHHLTARDNVALPAWRLGGSRAAALRRADELLERFGLTGRARARAGELSVGEAQRVAVARALANRPRVVLADEPTGSLDRASSDRVVDALMEVVGTGAALLVVTHDMEVARRAGRVIHMRDGRMVAAPEASEGAVDGRADPDARPAAQTGPDRRCSR